MSSKKLPAHVQASVAAAPPPSHEGWLQKQHKSGLAWQTRWCSLADRGFSYAKDPTAAAIACIPVQSIVAMRPEGDTDFVIDVKDKVFRFRSKDRADANIWMTTLGRMQAESLQAGGPRRSVVLQHLADASAEAGGADGPSAAPTARLSVGVCGRVRPAVRRRDVGPVQEDALSVAARAQQWRPDHEDGRDEGVLRRDGEADKSAQLVGDGDRRQCDGGGRPAA